MPGADLMTSFNDYCGLIINQFAHVYAAYYDADFKETVEHIESAKSKSEGKGISPVSHYR